MDDHLLPDFSKKNGTAKPGEHKIPPLFVRKFPDKGGRGYIGANNKVGPFLPFKGFF